MQEKTLKDATLVLRNSLLLVILSMGYCFCLTAQGFANSEHNYKVVGVYEVSNPIHLSDFQLGSQETIRDQDGFGGAIGRLTGDSTTFYEIELGVTSTRYQGKVEDGVNVDFVPQEGSSFEAISASTNIVYDVDLAFTNPYLGLSFTFWDAEMVRHYIPPSIGFGIIFQQASGKVVIRTKNEIEIARASYLSGTQYYLSWGGAFNFEGLYFAFLLRSVTSPILQINSCNEAAIGTLACERVRAATGNRNNASSVFTGGVVQFGLLF